MADAVDKHLGIPAEFVTEKPAGLRELFFGGALPHTVVTLDGPAWGHLAGQRVALRSLPASAQAQALGDAMAWLQKAAKIAREDIYGSEAGDGALETMQRAVILMRALLDPETLKPLCRDIGDVIGVLNDADPDEGRPGFTPLQIAWLFHAWDRFQRSRSPFTNLTPEGVEEHVAALGKGLVKPTSWSSYDRVTLERIATSLAETLATRTTPSSTATSSPTSSGDGSNES